jgi:Ni/Fe-hydrogenase 1 B-type cytochrome subunit
MKAVSFNQLHSRSLRLWHWCTFVVVLLILYTVFTGKFYLNPWGTAPSIRRALLKEGVTISNSQAFNAVNDLSAGIWKWHQYYGYVLSFLFLFRIILEFFQPSEEKFFTRMRNSFFFMRSKEVKGGGHYFIVRTVYLLFYFLLATIVTTGLTMSFLKNRFSEEGMHQVKQIHESCFYFLLLFTLMHITGVLLAERKRYKNIVSGMIHGAKQ